MTNLMKKIATAIRGGTRESMQSVVDANSLRIYEQEIHEAEACLARSKQQLAMVVADKIKLGRELDGLRAGIAAKETLASTHLQKGDESAATQVAHLLVDLEAQLQSVEKSHHRLVSYEAKLMKALKDSTRQIARHRSELRVAAATTQTQKMLSRLDEAADFADQSKLGAMRESLARIRERQSDFDDRTDAMMHINEELGLGDHKPATTAAASDILDRLREKT